MTVANKGADGGLVVQSADANASAAARTYTAVANASHDQLTAIATADIVQDEVLVLVDTYYASCKGEQYPGAMLQVTAAGSAGTICADKEWPSKLAGEMNHVKGGGSGDGGSHLALLIAVERIQWLHVPVEP